MQRSRFLWFIVFAALSCWMHGTAFSQTATDTPLSASTYLGGGGDDVGAAVAIASDGTVVVGGTFTDLPAPNAESSLLGADGTSPGAVLRFSADGKTLKSVTRLGNSVDDLELDPATDRIAVVGDFGLAVLSPDADQVLWSKSGSGIGDSGGAEYSAGRRVAVGVDGTVAALFNRLVWVFDAEGVPASGAAPNGTRIDIADTYIDAGLFNERVEDLAVDDAGGAVIVAGWGQTSAGAQTPSLVAIDVSDTFGAELWKDYNWWASALNSTTLKADSRMVRVSRGNDGNLYVSGYFDGGNTVFAKPPKYLDAGSNRTGYIDTSANNVEIDRWNNGAGANAGSFAWFGRILPENGRLDAGQFQYSSTGVNQPSGFSIFALTADSAGATWIGGRSVRDMPNRDDLAVNGVPIGPRVDNENALIAVSADFSERLRVASWTANGGSASRITAVAVRGGRVAVLGETEGPIVTASPVDGAKNAGTDVFFAVWGGGSGGLADAIAALQILAGISPSSIPEDVDGDGQIGLPEAIFALQAAADHRS